MPNPQKYNDGNMEFEKQTAVRGVWYFGVTSLLIGNLVFFLSLEFLSEMRRAACR
jgi:hypothetical protein